MPNGPFYYLAGPMRGHPIHNFPAFFHAEKRLRTIGIEVYNPAVEDMISSFNPGEPLDSEWNKKHFNLQSTFRDDLLAILDPRCLGIILLEGWKTSVGARLEVAVAVATGRSVYRMAHRVSDPHYTHLLPEKSLVVIEVQGVDDGP